MDNDAGVFLGDAGADNVDFLDGRIDEVRIYNLALSAGEVSTLYASYLNNP